jgi:hypothetical protein
MIAGMALFENENDTKTNHSLQNMWVKANKEDCRRSFQVNHNRG